MTKGNVTLESAISVAKKTSLETPSLIQVRQVSATEFGVFFADSPKFKAVGQLVGEYRNGRLVSYDPRHL